MYSKAKIEDTDSPDSGLKDMSSENLALNGGQLSEPIYWPSILRGQVSVSTSEGILTENHFSGIASITGNPFASGFEDAFGQNAILQCSYEERMKIITPIPPQDATSNRLELKLDKTPKIDPPPGFRNSKSYRDSQISAQSTDSASSQDTCSLMKCDSDYHSNTTGSGQSHGNENGRHVVMVHKKPSASGFQESDSVNSNSPLLVNEIHAETDNDSVNQSSYQNNGSDSRALSDTQFLDKYKETSSTLDSLHKLELQLNRINLDQKSASDYCLRTTNNGIKKDGSLRIKTIPPPPPPRRTESLSSDNGS